MCSDCRRGWNMTMYAGVSNNPWQPAQSRETPPCRSRRVSFAGHVSDEVPRLADEWLLCVQTGRFGFKIWWNSGLLKLTALVAKVDEDGLWTNRFVNIMRIYPLSISKHFWFEASVPHPLSRTPRSAPARRSTTPASRAPRRSPTPKSRAARSQTPQRRTPQRRSPSMRGTKSPVAQLGKLKFVGCTMFMGPVRWSKTLICKSLDTGIYKTYGTLNQPKKLKVTSQNRNYVMDRQTAFLIFWVVCILVVQAHPIKSTHVSRPPPCCAGCRV